MFKNHPRTKNNEENLKVDKVDGLKASQRRIPFYLSSHRCFAFAFQNGQDLSLDRVNPLAWSAPRKGFRRSWATL